ncbi:hypothetical protein [Agromyces arachidis]|uniref:hypothetical protein n=1 Tax=Agromyces arachidis TaxID=766966 RepID=UPI004055F953
MAASVTRTPLPAAPETWVAAQPRIRGLPSGSARLRRSGDPTRRSKRRDVTPPPPGPRDWSPPDDDSIWRTARPGQRPIRGAGHADGHAWAVTFGWTSLVIGIAAFVIGLAAPLAADPARVVWITGFGAVAVWAGLMAIPRYRRSGRGRSPLAITGITAGIATIATMAYAFTAIVLAPTTMALPAPAHWVGMVGESPGVPTTAVDAAPGRETTALDAPAPGNGGTAPAAEEAAALDPLESERLELAQSLGTATFVLRQTVSPDGTWPAYLAITTDGTTLMSPDGIILAPIPPGAEVLYSTSSDRTEYSLTMIGHSGVTATYVSSAGVIETAMP